VTTEYDLAFEDFSRELDALTEMAVLRPNAAAASMTSRARIAASNGATLLLAATFEEYVRQQVKAAYGEKVSRAKGIEDFPKKIAAVVWRRSLETLARTPFEDVESDVWSMDQRLASTIAFCLKKELTADVASTLAHNDSNMRASQLNTLFNQIGVPGISSKCCESRSLLDLLGSDSPGKGVALLEARIDEFFRRRNAVAHAIQLGSSSGPSELSNDIEFFRELGRSLAVAISTHLTPEESRKPVRAARRRQPAQAAG
jgi:hypothetical protein